MQSKTPTKKLSFFSSSGQMSSRREMHPYRQAPSMRDSPPHGQLSPYGPIPPQGYLTNPIYSNMPSNGQAYGGPPPNFPPFHFPYSTPSSSSQSYEGMPVDGQQQRYVMTPDNCAIPFQTSTPMSSTHSEDYHQISRAPSIDEVPIQNGFSNFDGQMPLCAIAQQAGALLTLQDVESSAHQSAYQHQGPQRQIFEQSPVEKPRYEPTKSDLIGVGQKPIEEPADDASVTLNPIDQRSGSLEPVFESGTNKEQNIEGRSTSQPDLSLDSPTPVSDAFDKQEKEDSDQEATNDETQQEDDIEKVDKYAFNFVREAYDHRVPQQLTKGVTLHVSSLAPMTTTLKQRREEVNDDTTPTLLPQLNEYQKGSKTVECVWVGMLPSPDVVQQMQSKFDQPSEETGGEEHSKKPIKKPIKKRGLKKTNNVSGMRDDEMKVIAFDQDALRVVAKKSDKVTRDIHIYALVHPHSTSQLQGFKVGFDDVFFFRDFRDDTARSILPRKKAAIARIKASVFRNVTNAVSQSPAPTAEQSLDQSPNATTALSPLSSLSSMVTPTPPPDNLSTRKTQVARPSRKVSTGEATHRVSRLSRLVSIKKAKTEKSTESRKRKAQNSIFDVLMNQREEARKKAKAEGYDVLDSDSELHDSVENDDQKAADDNSQDGDIAMGSVSDYHPDADVVVGHDSSTSHDIHMDISSQSDVDDEAFPEHAVRRHDPGFVNHMNDLINRFALEKSRADKGSHRAPFRHQVGQRVDKRGKAGSSSITDREDRDSDEEGPSFRAHPRNCAALADKIKSLVNKLATDQDVVGLQQALTMVRCIRKRCGPPKTSALSLYFNVTDSKEIRIEDCAEQLVQLRVSIDDTQTHIDLMCTLLVAF